MSSPRVVYQSSDHKSERDTHCGMQTNSPCCHCVTVDLLCCTSSLTIRAEIFLAGSVDKNSDEQENEPAFLKLFPPLTCTLLIIAPGKRRRGEQRRNMEHCISSVIARNAHGFPPPVNSE